MGSVVRASRMTALPTSRRPTRAAVAYAVLLLLAAPMAAAEPLAPGAASCLACHGADGAFPALGSLSARAIEDALAAYRSGARDGTVMPRIAKGFSDSESRAIARSLGGGTAGR